MIGYANLQQTLPNYNTNLFSMNNTNNYNSYGNYTNYNTSIYNNYFNSGSSVIAPQMVQQYNTSQMLMQFFGMIIPLLIQFLGKTNTASTTTAIDQTAVNVEKKAPDFSAVTTPATTANANVNGNGQTLLVQDPAGNNSSAVTGVDNRVEFIGDANANVFHVGGEDNEVSVYNIGSDDRIFLKGSKDDWEVVDLPQSATTRNSAHYVVFHNKKTDTYVKAASDEFARNENWIKSKISYE